MVYKRSFRRGSFRRSGRRYGRTTVRTKKLVDGHSPYTSAERMLNSGAGIARTVGALVKDVSTVMSLVNSETKYNDVLVTAADPTITTITPMTYIAEGDDETQRNGRSILGKDITVRYGFNLESGGPNVFMCAIVCDKENPQDALPTLAQIFENPLSPYTPILKDAADRFVIVKKQMFYLNTVSRTTHVGKMYVKVPFHIKYDDTDNTYLSADKNHLYFCVISDALAGDSVYTMYSRFNFLDN